jgi:hypothetical protein
VARAKTKPETALAIAEPGTVVPKPREVEAERRVAGLKRRVAMIEENDARIVVAMNKARDVASMWEPDDRKKAMDALASPTVEAVRALGFKDKRELRVALYGQLPKKEVPFFMMAAHDRVGMRIRRDSKAPTGNTFNLNMVTIPAPKPPGPEERVVIVQAEPRK